jgi:hypothetical protein
MHATSLISCLLLALSIANAAPVYRLKASVIGLQLALALTSYIQ